MPPPMPYEHKKVAPPKNFKDLFRFLKEIFGGFFTSFFYIIKLVWDSGKWILFLLSFVALFQGVAPIVNSIISKNVLNELQISVGQQNSAEQFWTSPVFYFLLLFFLFRFMQKTVSSFYGAMNRIAGEKVVQQVKLRIMNKSKELDLASFDDPIFYERMENANREAGHRPLGILSDTFGIVSTVIELVSYLIVLFSVPGMWYMAPVIVLLAIPLAVNYRYRRKYFRFFRWHSKDRRQMNYYSDLLVDKDRVKEVRLFGLADTFISRYKEVFAQYFKEMRSLVLSENWFLVGMGAVTVAVNCIFYVLIALKVFNRQIMIGDYTLYTAAILAVSGAVSTLINQSGAIYEGTLFIDNLISFMKEPHSIHPRTDTPVSVKRGCGHRIEFCHVSFSYPGTEKKVLDDLSFVLEPGQTMVLVGLNGAGKTTLIKLLTRLYDPTDGCILLDGVDLRDYDVDELYRIFGIIFQDFGKYAETVEQNIRFGDLQRKADRSDVEESIEQAAAKEFVDALPQGLDTPLTRIFEKNGLELSIGQWQKLSIARAFYSESDVLILDEPTASLDPLAEQEIFAQFDQLRKDKTTIFVSHRLSSATTADTVLVLENGRVEEMGHHEELMRRKGKYHHLFTTQAERYLSAEHSKED